VFLPQLLYKAGAPQDSSVRLSRTITRIEHGVRLARIKQGEFLRKSAPCAKKAEKNKQRAEDA
jgi:hypothetical protein